MTNDDDLKHKLTKKTDEEWQSILTPEQYRIMRQAQTETPFSGKYWNHWEKGYYQCAGCGKKLFVSDLKFDAGCGWPSFSQAIDDHAIEERADYSHGMNRIEVRCRTCDAHLGHVFNDGPQPSGLRYCINSAALEFDPRKKK